MLSLVREEQGNVEGGKAGCSGFGLACSILQLLQRQIRLSLIVVLSLISGAVGFVPLGLQIPSSTAIAATPKTTYYRVYYYNRRYPKNVFYYGEFTSQRTAQDTVNVISSAVYYAYYTSVTR